MVAAPCCQQPLRQMGWRARPGIRPRHNALMDLPGFTRASRDWFRRPVLELAPLLLGCALARTTGDGTVAVRITEVEAYAGTVDPGSHAFRGRTATPATTNGTPMLWAVL